MKAQDPMKDFFDANREAFDDLEAPEGMWDAIEEQLPSKEVKMVPLHQVLKVAAVAVVAVVLGIALLLPSSPEQMADKPSKKATESNADAFEQYPELAEAAFYYQVRISEAEEALGAYSIEESDFETLRLLEKEMEDLKADLGDQVDNERLIEAMMQIYQYKLNMLEQMLKQVKSIENENSENDEVVVVSM